MTFGPYYHIMKTKSKGVKIMGLFSFLKKKKPRKEVQEVKEVRSVNEVKPGIAVNDSPTIQPNIISAQSTSINEQKPVVAPVEKPVAKTNPKPAQKLTAEEEKAKAAKPSKYHVSQNKDAKSDAFRKWRVRKEGSQKTIKYFDTQKEAIAFAEDLAETNNSSIVVHKLDGTIRKQNY